MVSLTNIFVVILGVGQVYLAYGAPTENQLVRRARTPEPISTFTVDYFMSNKMYEPPSSSCLFYTAWVGATAQKYASLGGGHLTTIWDMWPCDYYNGDINDDNNILRDIFAKAQAGDISERTQYFGHMSEAMARSCDGSATVMTNFTDNIPQDGIWALTELPTLKNTGNAGGQVDTVTAIDLNGDSITTIWQRPIDGIVIVPINPVPRPRRNSDPSRCYDPKLLHSWFGAVPW